MGTFKVSVPPLGVSQISPVTVAVQSTHRSPLKDFLGSSVSRNHRFYGVSARLRKPSSLTATAAQQHRTRVPVQSQK